MSETKHTPLPWGVGVDERGYERKYEGPGIYCRKDCDEQDCLIAETLGGFDDGVPEANAQLIITSVNARPKVEELLKLIRQMSSHDEQVFCLTECFPLIEAKAREVEAALKGEA